MEATVGDPADPVIIHTSKVRGAELTSSYEEEKAKALIRRTFTDPPSNRPRTTIVFEHYSWKADCTTDSLALLRPGHTPLLKAYAHLLDPATDPTCTICK